LCHRFFDLEDEAMPVLSARVLNHISETLFVAAGVPDDEAAIVAQHLADANLVGHDSHGIRRVPDYVQRIRDGVYVPGAPFEIVAESETTAVYDGGWGMGQVQATRALERLLDKAQRHGTASVGLRKAGHIGRLGYYTERAAAGGMLGMCAANGHNVIEQVVPWGGIDRRLGTNPIAYAVPTGVGFPLVLDVATSAAAEGKLRVYRNLGKPIPEGWVIDKEGNPTTDPGAYYDGGALLPFGGGVGHKGFGMGFMAEVMAGALAGTSQVETEPWRYGCNGVFMMAVRIDALRPLEAFVADVDALIDYIKSSRKAPGFDEILVPGEFEARNRRVREREGVQVDDETWRQIAETARSLGHDLEALAQD
jgi:uncharacterized oxidoreductase